MNDSILSPNYFARLSAKLQAMLLGVVTCGRELCYWIHRKSREFRSKLSEPVEIDLKDFVAYSGLGRAREYCIRHVRRNFLLLEARGFITVIKRFSADIYRLVVHDPDVIADICTKEEKIPTTYKKAPIGSERSRSQASNPHSTVASKDPFFKENADNASEDDQGDAAISLDSNKTQILEEIRAMGATLNPTIQRFVAQASIESLIAALAAVRQRRASGIKIPNMGGYIVAAIKGGWHPNEKGDRPSDRPTQPATEKTTPPDFPEWMHQARRAGIASEWKWENDQIMVQDSNGNWVEWEEFRGLFSTQRLAGMPSFRG